MARVIVEPADVAHAIKSSRPTTHPTTKVPAFRHVILNEDGLYDLSAVRAKILQGDGTITFGCLDGDRLEIYTPPPGTKVDGKPRYFLQEIYGLLFSNRKGANLQTA